MNEKSKAYPTKPAGTSGSNNTLQDWLVTDYLAANSDAKMINNETMELPAKKLTKASGASNELTWLAVNQNAVWNAEMQMTFVEILPVSANEDYVKTVKAGGKTWTGRQYIEYVHVDGQLLTTTNADKAISYSMAGEGSGEVNKGDQNKKEGDGAMLSFATSLGTLATAIAILNF